MSEPLRITLSRCGDYFALVDPEALEIIRPYTWSLHRCGKGKLYARAEWCRTRKVRVRLYMHRLIAAELLDPPPGDGYVLDHIDGDGLNNRLANFRWLKSFDNRWRYARHRSSGAGSYA